MPNCKQCKKHFPNLILLDGKKRNLQRRKFCLGCSPFGTHNTSNIAGRKMRRKATTKKCLECKQTFSLSLFYAKSNRIKEYYSSCKTCFNIRCHNRQKETKAKAVEYLGGSCVVCNYNNYSGSLDFHHVDPSQKDFEISSVRSISFEKLKPELDKCILVCRNCHGEIHAGQHPEHLKEGFGSIKATQK